jgi:hypothetical protein
VETNRKWIQYQSMPVRRPIEERELVERLAESAGGAPRQHLISIGIKLSHQIAETGAQVKFVEDDVESNFDLHEFFKSTASLRRKGDVARTNGKKGDKFTLKMTQFDLLYINELKERFGIRDTSVLVRIITSFLERIRCELIENRSMMINFGNHSYRIRRDGSEVVRHATIGHVQEGLGKLLAEILGLSMQIEKHRKIALSGQLKRKIEFARGLCSRPNKQEQQRFYKALIRRETLEMVRVSQEFAPIILHSSVCCCFHKVAAWDSNGIRFNYGIFGVVFNNLKQTMTPPAYCSGVPQLAELARDLGIAFDEELHCNYSPL